VEAKLGTSPTNVDSDGDGIRDNIEVQGFLDKNGRRWYLNPKNPDTNGDGHSDGEECAPLVGLTTLDPATVVDCDSDGDGVPDPFDLDDDGDGVPDQVDVTPGGSLGRDGKTYDPANPQAFDASHPFSLKVNNLLPGKPAIVDIQLRPVNAKHLTYAMNVFDWPSSDIAGQIQHVKETTFATGNAAGAATDPRLGAGDMRLIPMLEIELNGTSMPLSLTVPSIDVAVRGPISATVHLEQNATDTTKTDLRFTFADKAQTYTVNIFEGACPASGTPLLSSALSVGDGATTTIPLTGIFDNPAGHRITILADGKHVLKLTGGGKTACQPIGNIINGPYSDKMVDTTPLQPYGISVREKNDAGALLVYIPLSVVADPTGGAAVAFSARMIYWPATADAWQQAQQVRVVWLVQMLTDQCDTTGFTPSAAAQADSSQYDAERQSWCRVHRTPDSTQVVQTYDESWFLTGLAVHEDLGMDVAIAWENPTTDNDLNADDRLWQLARGLLNSFLIGRDENNNHVLDIGVVARNAADSTIQDRFDSGGSVPDGDDRRWGIPMSALRVETVSYPHGDYVGYIAAHDTPQILKENFDSYRTIAPTLLFAREQTGIDLNLATTSNIVSSTVTLDFAGHSPTTMTSLSWSPYRYNTNTGPDGKVIGWQTYPFDEYWDRMETQYTDAFRGLPRDGNRYGTSETAIIGQMLVARGLFATLNRGLTNLVQFGSQNDGTIVPVSLTWEPGNAAEEDINIAKGVLGMIGSSYWVIADMVNDFADAFGKAMKQIETLNTLAELPFAEVSAIDDATAFLQARGAGFNGIKSAWQDLFSMDNLYVTINSVDNTASRSVLGAGSIIAFAIGAAAVVACLAAIGWNIATGADPITIIKYTVTIVGIVVQMKGTIQAFKSAAKMLAGLEEIKTVSASLKETSTKLSAIGFFIGGVIAWALFAVQAALSDLSYQQMGILVAQTIGQTIVLVSCSSSG
jgi:hypothetical protein